MAAQQQINEAIFVYTPDPIDGVQGVNRRFHVSPQDNDLEVTELNADDTAIKTYIRKVTKDCWTDLQIGESVYYEDAYGYILYGKITLFDTTTVTINKQPVEKQKVISNYKTKIVCEEYMATRGVPDNIEFKKGDIIKYKRTENGSIEEGIIGADYTTVANGDIRLSTNIGVNVNNVIAVKDKKSGMTSSSYTAVRYGTAQVVNDRILHKKTGGNRKTKYVRDKRIRRKTARK